MARSSAGDEWEVHFARFFCYPRRPLSASDRLKRLPRSKTRTDGTWIAAETTAALRIARSGCGPVPVLSVAVAGFVVEEHFVCNLHYSWPQVSCVSQCPIRGSKGVFLSYRDGSGKIQKFAVRFPAGSDAENFMDSVKRSLQKTADSAPGGSNVLCENSSSPNAFTASSGLHYSCEEPAETCAPELPPLTYDVEESEPSLPSLLANNINTIFSGLPPSFTELLNNCSSDAERERSTGEIAKGAPVNKECPRSSSARGGGSVLPALTTDAELKSQIVKYMTDSAFHDMLSKIERVMDEMGGDLCL